MPTEEKEGKDPSEIIEVAGHKMTRAQAALMQRSTEHKTIGMVYDTGNSRNDRIFIPLDAFRRWETAGRGVDPYAKITNVKLVFLSLFDGSDPDNNRVRASQFLSNQLKEAGHHRKISVEKKANEISVMSVEAYPRILCRVVEQELLSVQLSLADFFILTMEY